MLFGDRGRSSALVGTNQHQTVPQYTMTLAFPDTELISIRDFPVSAPDDDLMLS